MLFARRVLLVIYILTILVSQGIGLSKNVHIYQKWCNPYSGSPTATPLRMFVLMIYPAAKNARYISISVDTSTAYKLEC